MSSLHGKVALVTGASSGIGRAVAGALARLGVKPMLVARSADRLEKLAGEIGQESALFPADLTDPVQVERIVPETLRRFGRIDIVLANAGIYLAGDVKEGDPDAWDRLITTNVS